MKYTTKQFIKYAKTIHENKYSYEKVNYINSRIPIIIICPKHGEFKQRPKDHLYGRGCKKCSNGVSNKCSKWLEQFEKIKREQTIIINDKKYIVDGFNKTTNTIYEFWGDFWHGNPRKYDPDDVNPINKTKFGVLYKRTIEKIKNIKKAGFKLISVWEDDWDKQER